MPAGMVKLSSLNSGALYTTKNVLYRKGGHLQGGIETTYALTGKRLRVKNQLVRAVSDEELHSYMVNDQGFREAIISLLKRGTA